MSKAVITPDTLENEDAQHSQALYPIRTVSSLTGVNPITLRAWERRYGLINPVRTAKGHRLYSREDINLIHQIMELLDKGVSISQVQQTLQEREETVLSIAPEDVWTRYRQHMILAISRFDETALDDIYNEALSLYPVDVVTDSLVIPLLETLGKRWDTREGTVAEEHFFNVFLRNKLGARFHHRVRQAPGPRLLCACLPNEKHELGLLLFALSAHASGCKLVILGANLPYDELPLAVKRSRSEAVVLSGSRRLTKEIFAEPLLEVVKNIQLPVFIGGECSILYRDEIIRAGAIPVGKEIMPGVKMVIEYLADLPA